MDRIEELPEFEIQGVDTVAKVKVHRVVHRTQLVFGSFVGSGNAIKVLRAGMSAGLRGNIDGRSVTIPKFDDIPKPYLWRQCGLISTHGPGYVHAVMRLEHPEYLVVLDGDNLDEWNRELHRLSTVPLLPDYIPYLRDKIRAECTCLKGDELCGFGCDAAEVCKVDDDTIARLLVEGAKAGAIDLPECEHNLAGFEGLKDYIHHYAGKMVDSTGSSLTPLFDPRRDHAEMPAGLRRQPFAPQAWMIESIRRAIA